MWLPTPSLLDRLEATAAKTLWHSSPYGGPGRSLGRPSWSSQDPWLNCVAAQQICPPPFKLLPQDHKQQGKGCVLLSRGAGVWHRWARPEDALKWTVECQLWSCCFQDHPDQVGVSVMIILIITASFNKKFKYLLWAAVKASSKA